uniref:Uncharacterized protein n=1 Tax=viral metagenome TaxID=1070528 RepID=A0A6M3LGJ4_9ZZZZ
MAKETTGAKMRREKAEKREKTPIAEFSRGRLTVPPGYKKEGYFYYWFNDTPGRIMDKMSEGYRLVPKKGLRDVAGDADITNQPRPEVHVCKPVGAGMMAYLMEIPQDVYDQLRAPLEERNERLEQALRNEGPRLQPDDGISPDRRHNRL